MDVLDALDLARWQFGITTVYHFLFVPVTIGMAWFVAFMQTAHLRTGNADYLRLTRFFGKLFLINFAIGVATGIVQEFQFGMNWSAYSKYVGDVFGAPLAVEGLVAFFLESTFLGLWIFGWGKLSPRIHLATIYLVAVGTTASAYFILAANSWMQHPVGYRIDHHTGRAVMTSIFQVLTNSTLIYTFGHTMAAAFVTAGMLVLGVSAYHLRRGRNVEVFRRSATTALVITCIGSIAVIMIGHGEAQLMTRQQPMKMAAAEALWNTSSPAPFSRFTVGSLKANPGGPAFQFTLPHGLSILATNSWNGRVKGINQVQAAERAKYGPGNYVPIVGVTYWTFRVMTGIGFAMLAFALCGLFLVWRGTLTSSRRYQRLAIWAIALPFLANATGWIFTEMGRQPWAVYGLLLTRNSVSPSVSAWEVGLTLAGFTLIYAVLAVIEAGLMFTNAKGDPPEPGDSSPEMPTIAMSY